MWYLNGITFYSPSKKYIKNIFGKVIAEIDGPFSIIEYNSLSYISSIK